MKIIEINKHKKKIKLIKNLNILTVIGPLGTLSFNLDPNFNITNNSTIFISNESLNFFFNKIKSIFKSVATGCFLELTLNGIGYKSFKIDDKIALDVGYSNLIIYKPTTKLKIKNLKNKIILFSIDKEYLNNVATLLKNYSIPDKYKGKGILFKNEVIKLKKKAKT
jgi:large subunit ribosomal protein L6